MEQTKMKWPKADDGFPVAPITFPVFAIRAEGVRPPGNNTDPFVYFANEEWLSMAVADQLKRGEHQGMLLIDNAGRSWRILRVETLGLRGGLLGRILTLIGIADYDVSYEMEEAPPIPMAELQERVCESFKADPAGWFDPEFPEGEPVREPEDVMKERVARVLQTKTVKELILHVFGDDLTVS